MSAIANQSRFPANPPQVGQFTILPAVDAQALYQWNLPDVPADRARLLAETILDREPGRRGLAIVFEPNGSAFGTLSIRGKRFAFTLPASRGMGQFQIDLYKLGISLSEISTTKGVLQALWEFWSNDSGGSITARRTRAIGLELFEVLPRKSKENTRTNYRSERTPLKELLATYEDGTCEWAQPNVRVKPPQPRDVKRVILGFLPLLYPGYHGSSPTDRGFTSFVLRRLSALQQRLNRLVTRALAFQAATQSQFKTAAILEDWRVEAEERVLKFFERLPNVRRALSRDAQAAYDRDPALYDWERDQVPLAYPGLFATTIYRLAHELHRVGVPYIPRMATEFAHSKTGIDIHPAAEIEHGLFIDHGNGVVIGQTAKIGKDVTIYQGVTIGAKFFPREENGDLARGAPRHPTIGDNVVAYANAAALGLIHVGRGTTIGSNVSLRQSTDPESDVRLPLSLRECSISSPRLALEEPIDNAGQAETPHVAAEVPDPEAQLPNEFLRGKHERDEIGKRDPETGLPLYMVELKRDEREYRPVPKEFRS